MPRASSCASMLRQVGNNPQGSSYCRSGPSRQTDQDTRLQGHTSISQADANRILDNSATKCTTHKQMQTNRPHAELKENATPKLQPSTGQRYVWQHNCLHKIFISKAWLQVVGLEDLVHLLLLAHLQAKMVTTSSPM